MSADCTTLIKGWAADHEVLLPLLTAETEKFMRCQLTWSKGWPARATQEHKMCRLGDENVTYSHKGRSKPVYHWTPTTALLAQRIEDEINWEANCCVVNTYGPGGDLHPHRDSEFIPQLGENPTIASVSFGQARIFLLYPLVKGKRQEAIEVLLEPGDLFIMHGRCDAEFHHAIKPENVPGSRLSLTFRKHLV